MGLWRKRRNNTIFTYGDGGGGGPTTTPSYIATGTVSAGTSSIAPAYGTNAAGDLFVMQVIVRNQTVAPTTPSGWTLQDGPDTVGPIGQYWYTRDARSTGSESGTVSIPDLAGNSIIAAIHTFRNVATSSFVESLSTYGEDASPARQTVEAPSVTAGGNARLAVCMVAVSFNANTIDSFTGETGGDWTEAFYSGTGIGSNCEMQLQTAALSSGGTISGGSSANSDDEYMLHGFALVGV